MSRLLHKAAHLFVWGWRLKGLSSPFWRKGGDESLLFLAAKPHRWHPQLTSPCNELFHLPSCSIYLVRVFQLNWNPVPT